MVNIFDDYLYIFFIHIFYMKIRLKLIESSEEIARVYDFLKAFPLEYPNYSNWLKKCRKELKEGHKSGFYAKISSKIIGSIIFQKHKQQPSVLEIKNLRVAGEYKNKGVGTQLLDLTEELAKKKNFKGVQIDTHSENIDMINFLLKRGFKIEKQEPLYNPKKQETILHKKI